MKWFASTYPDFPILQVALAKFKEKPISQTALAQLANGKKTDETVGCREPAGKIKAAGSSIDLLSLPHKEAQSLSFSLLRGDYGLVNSDIHPA